MVGLVELGGFMAASSAPIDFASGNHYAVLGVQPNATEVRRSVVLFLFGCDFLLKFGWCHFVFVFKVILMKKVPMFFQAAKRNRQFLFFEGVIERLRDPRRPRSVSQGELAKAYRMLALKYHPDPWHRNGGRWLVG